MFDLILKNATLVDPLNTRQGSYDIAISEGRIALVQPQISAPARAERDLSGLHVMPGIIDTHVHLSSLLGGRYGHRMLAATGVTFALDMAGSVKDVLAVARDHGTGLTIGVIDALRPGGALESAYPSEAELDAALSRLLQNGALGLKILGGHYPLCRDATATAIRLAANRGAYAALHAGTIEAPKATSASIAESIELAAGHPLHLAHINSYVRDESFAGGEAACRMLAGLPNIWSESYLAPFNGFSAGCSNGVPNSLIAANAAREFGNPATEAGIAQTILQGDMYIHTVCDGRIVLRTGEEGLAAWREAQTMIGASCMVNEPEPRMHLVSAKDENGAFFVDCLATDGGGIPRNDICERGLGLVRLSALSLSDFVVKASVNPARMLGLGRKGHLGEGADADITVLDMDRLAPVMSLVEGQILLDGDKINALPTKVLTTPQGRAAVQDCGLAARVVEFGSLLPAKSA